MGIVQKRVDVSIKPNKLTVKPIRIKVKPTGEEVVWHCKGGRLDILFNKVTSPFRNSQMQVAESTDLSSGAPITSTHGPYPYTLVITPSDGSYPITVDPQVDIDNPGPVTTQSARPGMSVPRTGQSPAGTPSGQTARKAARRKRTVKKAVRASRRGKKK